MCLYLLENPRKKESVVLELVCSCVNKFLLMGSNRMLVVYVLLNNFDSFIVDSGLP